MDQFSIESSPQDGEIVSMAKRLPRVAVPSSREVARIAVELARHAPQGLLEELRQQNQELLSTLQELRDRQAELASMHSASSMKPTAVWSPFTPSWTRAPSHSSVCRI